MSGPAKVTSIDAVKHFLVAVKGFDHGARDALTQLILEARRAVDWMEVDRARYWPGQVRKASHELGEARVNLERCEMSITPGERKACYEEKKAFEKAKQRLRTAQEKVKVVQRWKRKVRQEAEEFEVQMSRMNGLLDSEVPRAVASLERMIRALDRYTETKMASDSGPPAAGLTSTSDIDDAEEAPSAEDEA